MKNSLQTIDYPIIKSRESQDISAPSGSPSLHSYFEGKFNFIGGHLIGVNDKIQHLQNKVNSINKTTLASHNLLESCLKKTKNQRSKGLAVRDCLTKEIYDKIMSEKRKPGQGVIPYSRFRVALTLLYLFGFRANEIRVLTKEDFESAFIHREFQIYQQKTRTFRKVSINPKALIHLKKLDKDIKTVFYKHEFLGGNEKKWSKTCWLKFLNCKLKGLTRNSGKTLKTHSCRINFVTELLKHNPVHKVSRMIGHKDIKTTLLYDRYLLTNEEYDQATSILLD